MPKNPSAKSHPVMSLTLSRKAAAEALGVDIQTIDGYISSGKLRASKLGTRVLIRVRDVEAMLDASAVAANG
jgi:excisionase family DNA binding protein